MKALLYKEFKLAKHPTLFIFPVFALMLLIPSYPYYLAFMYTLLAVFYLFLAARENNDTVFTVMLPIRKRDAVKARVVVVLIAELAQIVICIPFAILGAAINPNPEGNSAGIEANVALFGFALIMYALFNLIFLPMFYKTGYKVGVPFLAGGLAASLLIGIFETAVNWIGVLKSWLDTADASMQVSQLPILAAGIVIFAAAAYLAYRLSAANFEKVDL